MSAPFKIVRQSGRVDVYDGERLLRDLETAVLMARRNVQLLRQACSYALRHSDTEAAVGCRTVADENQAFALRLLEIRRAARLRGCGVNL